MQGVNRAQDFTELLGEVKGLKRRAKASLELEEIDMDNTPNGQPKVVAPVKQGKKETFSWRKFCLSFFFSQEGGWECFFRRLIL